MTRAIVLLPLLVLLLAGCVSFPAKTVKADKVALVLLKSGRVSPQGTKAFGELNLWLTTNSADEPISLHTGINLIPFPADGSELVLSSFLANSSRIPKNAWFFKSYLGWTAQAPKSAGTVVFIPRVLIYEEETVGHLVGLDKALSKDEVDDDLKLWDEPSKKGLWDRIVVSE